MRQFVSLYTYITTIFVVAKDMPLPVGMYLKQEDFLMVKPE